MVGPEGLSREGTQRGELASACSCSEDIPETRGWQGPPEGVPPMRPSLLGHSRHPDRLCPLLMLHNQELTKPGLSLGAGRWAQGEHGESAIFEAFLSIY